MNLYFLVEGKETEPKVYPQWLIHLAPELSQVNFAQDAKENNFYLISGFGTPHILTHTLPDSVKEINELGNFDYLVFVIDTDDMSELEKTNEIEQFIIDQKIILNPNCKLKIIAQKYCIETWFLGNRTAYSRTPSKQSDFYQHAKFYDVSQNDPESMNKPEWFNSGSASIFHEIYLRKMLAEKHIRYAKSKPDEVCKQHYLVQLKNRVAETAHLPSLNNFFEFCDSISVTR